MLQALERGIYVFSSCFQTTSDFMLLSIFQRRLVGSRDLFKSAQERAAAFKNLSAAKPGAGWDRHRGQHAGDGGMDTRQEERKP